VARWLLLCGYLLTTPGYAEHIDMLQDPTWPLAGLPEYKKGGGQVDVGLPKLQSIIQGNGSAVAVLNGQPYQIGQQVAGYRLVAIGADSVALEKAGKRHQVTLFARKIKV
jgi:MSHA biogenesis protein MshK